MTKRLFATTFMGLVIAGTVPGSNAAWAADLTVYEQSPTCQTVFVASPVPPYFTRHGCIQNVITVHRLPERRLPRILVYKRDVVVIERPLLVDVYK